MKMASYKVKVSICKGMYGGKVMRIKRLQVYSFSIFFFKLKGLLLLERIMFCCERNSLKLAVLKE